MVNINNTGVVVPAGLEKDISRLQAIEWINNVLKAEFSEIEQLHAGDAYCLMNSLLFPGSIPLRLVKWNPRTDAECRDNWKLLQTDWEKRGVSKRPPVDKLVKGKFQDNFEFFQWFKPFFEANIDASVYYDPMELRGGVEMPNYNKFSANRQRFPSAFRRRESISVAYGIGGEMGGGAAVDNNRPSLGRFIFSGEGGRPSIGAQQRSAPRTARRPPQQQQQHLNGRGQRSTTPMMTTMASDATEQPPSSICSSLQHVMNEMDTMMKQRNYYREKCRLAEQYCRIHMGRVCVAAEVLELLKDDYSSSLGSSAGSRNNLSNVSNNQK